MPVDQPCNVYRKQLSSLYHGLASWKPNLEGLYDQVAIGDVGYLSEGAFIRMFNVTLPWDDESNRTLGIPDRYDFLNSGNITIRRETFSKVEYYSRHVSREENINNAMAATPEQAEGVTYRCRGRGALLSLPHGGHHEYAIHLKVFEKYIRDHVASQPVQLVKGHRTARRVHGRPRSRPRVFTSWAAGAQLSLKAERSITEGQVLIGAEL